MEYFSAVKGKKVLINLTVWMNLRNMLKKENRYKKSYVA